MVKTTFFPFSMQESRDNWGLCYPPEEKEPIELGEEPSKEDQYRVSIEWLLEMEEYNEYMVEEDYEVEANGAFKSNELNMEYDEFAASEEKPPASASKKKGGKNQLIICYQ